MRTEGYSDISITVSSFFLKCTGLWMTSSDTEERRSKIALAYVVWTVMLSFLIELRDLYFTWGDFSAALYVFCNVLSLTIASIKVVVIIARRVEFIGLIQYMQEHFWNTDYNYHEKKILANSRKTCIFFITIVTFIGHCAIVSYIVTPLFVNAGKNKSERILPFNMWLDLPLSVTPYYEMMFCVQVATLYPIGVCYFSFDNILCIMSLHVAGQFRVLQDRLTRLLNLKEINDKNGNIDLINSANSSYTKLQNCIRQHQELINFCEKLENVFTRIILAQVLVFSILICLFGYQVVLGDSTSARRFIFIFLLVGSSSLLLMFTYSCHGLIEQSDNVGNAAYSAPWTLMPMTEAGKMLRHDIMIIMLRSKRICCLTANGFFPISLETYISILSTAVSYFTLLRQSSQSIIEN